MDKFYNYSEEESQDGNDKIALFYGGVIEPAFGGGEQYRFDSLNTMEFLMKCPPFGIIPRCDNQGTRGMQFHWNFNHLMPIIKECWNKMLIDERLKDAYEDIKNRAFDFSLVSDNQALYAHRAVLDFIDVYSDLK
jgi:hypothetical protein